METKENFIGLVILIVLFLFVVWIVVKTIKKIIRILSGNQNKGIKMSEQRQVPNTATAEIKKPPTILSDLVQPGFPAKIFTLFFLDDALVFVKTGAGSTDIAGSQRAFHGGFSATALITGGIGKLFDSFLSKRRGNKAAQIASYNSEEMVNAHKRNFKINYENVLKVEIKKPGFIGEMKIIFTAGKTHKFKVNTKSDFLINYYIKTLTEYLPGKIIVL